MREKLALKEIQCFSELSQDPDLREFLMEYQTSWTDNGNIFLKVSDIIKFFIFTWICLVWAFPNAESGWVGDWKGRRWEDFVSAQPIFGEGPWEKPSGSEYDARFGISVIIIHINTESILYDGSKIKFLSLDYLQDSILPPNTEIQEPPTKHLPPELLQLPIDTSTDLRLSDLFLLGILAYWLFFSRFHSLIYF